MAVYDIIWAADIAKTLKEELSVHGLSSKQEATMIINAGLEGWRKAEGTRNLQLDETAGFEVIAVDLEGKRVRELKTNRAQRRKLSFTKDNSRLGLQRLRIIFSRPSMQH
eukprot:GHVU01155396.1.p5 GENE.GHVU01155396.1~~GHVU01155396.1.p5  ORF type:complete len:110 (+),score=13.26 GHVU01155396.1:1018-1347(+)